MWAGAGSPEINGSPLFVGGALPTTWAGFKLASNSPGRNAGTDGLDVGIKFHKMAVAFAGETFARARISEVYTIMSEPSLAGC